MQEPYEHGQPEEHKTRENKIQMLDPIPSLERRTSNIKVKPNSCGKARCRQKTKEWEKQPRKNVPSHAAHLGWWWWWGFSVNGCRVVADRGIALKSQSAMCFQSTISVRTPPQRKSKPPNTNANVVPLAAPPRRRRVCRQRQAPTFRCTVPGMSIITGTSLCSRTKSEPSS